MPRRVSEKKVQFSIYMDASVKDALERIATHQGLSLSALLELMGENLVNSIDPSMWQRIDEIEKALGQATSIATLETRPFAAASGRQKKAAS